LSSSSPSFGINRINLSGSSSDFVILFFCDGLVTQDTLPAQPGVIASFARLHVAVLFGISGLSPFLVYKHRLS
jgi:hypothetical protein